MVTSPKYLRKYFYPWFLILLLWFDGVFVSHNIKFTLTTTGNAIGQLCTDFEPKFQRDFHEQIVKILVKFLKEDPDIRLNLKCL